MLAKDRVTFLDTQKKTEKKEVLSLDQRWGGRRKTGCFPKTSNN